VRRLQDLRREAQILRDRQFEKEIGDLERSRDAGGLQAIGRRAGIIDAVDQDTALVRPQRPGDEVEQGPMMVVMRLRATSRLTWSTARNPPKRMETPRSCSTGALMRISRRAGAPAPAG
jgi:hypothetical protein